MQRLENSQVRNLEALNHVERMIVHIYPPIPIGVGIGGARGAMAPPKILEMLRHY